MTITIRKLHPRFGAEIGGVDISRPVPADVFAEIRAAFEEYSVLLFRGQDMDDEKQIAFSELFGPLETTLKANPAAGTVFARQSNLDIKTGEVIPADDRRMIYQKANMLWHSDSSYKHVPSLCSVLSTRIVPPEGGNTEFASLRAAWDDLPEATRKKVEGLVVEHCLAYSRARVAPDLLTEEMLAEVPPVKHVLVRTNPVNGRKSLYLGAHALKIDGWPDDEARRFLDELTERATTPDKVYSHEWRDGDLIVWDNRCVVHRATPYDAIKYKRLMQRTTIAGDTPTVP